MASVSNRNHALESLERRFEVAKSELLHQHKKLKAVDTPAKGESATQVSSSSVFSEKGRFLSPKRRSSGGRDGVVENEFAYMRLAHPIDQKLALDNNTRIENKQKGVTDKILHDLLRHGDSGRKYMQGSRNIKIDNWILIDNYAKSRPSTSSHVRALRAHSKRSKKRLSMRQHKKLGTLHLPRDAQRYDVFKPMHEMWKEYMAQLLKGSGKNQLSQSLLNADLHGAIIFVVDCKMASYIGIGGIMVRETAETLGIITKDDALKVVPKRFSVFVFQLASWKVTVYGDKLLSRSLSL